MSYCNISLETGIFANTPVPNLFIQEYMLKAPGDYVKVYIYGWMHSVYPSMAEQTAERFAASLHMDAQSVDKAFAYWKSKGLIRDNQGSYEFLDVRNTLFDSHLTSSDARMYEHASLSNALSAAAGDHALTHAEFDMLYDLYDLDNFEEDALVMMLEHCSTLYMGKKFTKSRLESVAREWKRAGAITSQKAAEYRTGMILRNSPANKILNELGITKRNVSLDEHNLYRKWTEEWGFTLEAVRVARESMTGSQNPNFKYLDKRIKTLFERGLNTAKKIRDGESVRGEQDELVQSCMFRLGMVGMVTDEHRRYYSNWAQGYAMNHKAILMACDEVCAQGNASFKAAESLISSYARRGMSTQDDIKRERAITDQMLRILKAAGVSRMPTEADKELLEKWMKDSPLDVITYAAELSAGTARPMGYMARVLEGWQKQGVRTLDVARAQHMSHSKSSKSTSGVHYGNEREYTKGSLDDLLEDVLDDNVSNKTRD